MAMVISNSIYSFVVAIVVDCVCILAVFRVLFIAVSPRPHHHYLSQTRGENVHINFHKSQQPIAIVYVWVRIIVIVMAYISAQTHSISDVHNKTMAKF